MLKMYTIYLISCFNIIAESKSVINYIFLIYKLDVTFCFL